MFSERRSRAGTGKQTCEENGGRIELRLNDAHLGGGDDTMTLGCLLTRQIEGPFKQHRDSQRRPQTVRAGVNIHRTLLQHAPRDKEGERESETQTGTCTVSEGERC